MWMCLRNKTAKKKSKKKQSETVPLRHGCYTLPETDLEVPEFDGTEEVDESCAAAAAAEDDDDAVDAPDSGGAGVVEVDTGALGGSTEAFTSPSCFLFANSVICESSAARMAAALSRLSMNASASKSFTGSAMSLAL